MRGGIRSLHVRGAVPGIVVRLLVVAIVWVGVVQLNPFPLWQAIGMIAALVSVVLPRSLAAWAGAGCVVFGVILTEPAPERTALAVLLVHAVHVCASLSLAIPISSRLALRVLVPSAVRFLVVQLIAQPLVFAVWLLGPERLDDGIAWLAPFAAILLLLGVILALHAAKKADIGRQAGAGGGAESVPAAPRGADVRGPS